MKKAKTAIRTPSQREKSNVAKTAKVTKRIDLAARLKEAFPDGPVKDSAELLDYMRGKY